MFNLSSYGMYFSPVFKQKSPLRVLSEYEIELYCSTSKEATAYLDNTSFSYPVDRICVYRPGQRRQSKGQFRCYYLKFECDAPEITELLDKLPTRIPAGDTRTMYELFSEIFSIMAQKHPGYKLHAYAKVCEMIASLYAQSCSAAKVGGKYAAYTAEIYEAIRYMHEHLGEHITLEDMAGFVHLSSSFFHVVFKEIMQKTPHRYLLELRLSQAKNLLINSDMSLALIAEKCGFDSQVYFNYIIKKELGITPKKYRDTNRNKYYTI
ncbi:MAG: helix-turn-helix transcriptional regulator [Clostridia bacterium]|nr:helix-turn-helix transcriptional regulator [Clostridia bacterium]